MNLNKIFILLIIAITLIPIPAWVWANDGKKIVIIHSYSSCPWVSGINKGFKETIEALGTKVKIKSIQFPVDRIRRKDSNRVEIEKNKIIELTKKYDPDVVLLCDDEVTDVLMPVFMTLGLPTFVTGINNLEPAWKQDRWKYLQSGVFEKYPIDAELNFLKKIQPSCEKISILSSRSTTSTLVAATIKSLFENGDIEKKYNIKLQGIHLLEKYIEWQKMVPQLGHDNDALFILVPYEVVDDKGFCVPPEQIGGLLKANLKIPTLGIISIHTRIGLFASISVEGAGLGRQSAEQIHRFFNGESMENLGFEDIRYHNFEINANEAKRLNIKIPAEFYGLTHFLE